METRGRLNFGEYLFWIGYISLILWVIAKLLGLINTPLILEMFPIITAIFIAGGVYQEFRHMGKDIHNLGIKVDNMDKRLIRIEYDLEKHIEDKGIHN